MTADGWRCVELSAIAEVRLGRQRSPSRAKGPNMRPYLRAANVGWGKLRLDDIKEMDFSPKEFEVYRLEPGDILLNEASGSPAEVGKPVIYRGEVANACFQNTILRIRLQDAESAETRYLYHHLYRDAKDQRFADSSRGTNIQHIGRTRLAAWETLLPPLVEQHEIAEVLDTVDAAIRKTEQIIAKLKQVKQGLLHDLLTRGIDDNGELRDPDRHPEQFKDSRLGRIPKAWGVKPAQEVCTAVIDCKNRTPPATAGGYPVIRTPNVRDGEFVSKGMMFTDEQSHVIWTQRGAPRHGDILITREAPVGEVCLLPNWLPAACLGQRMMMYQPDPSVLINEFMVPAIQSRAVQLVLADWAGGSTVGHVRVGDIRRLPIPIPALGEQKAIADTWNTIRNRCATETIELHKLRLLKQGLMEDLLTGRVRVTPLLETPSK